MKRMTVAAMIERLQRYAPDDACCGTFWLAEDFRMLDDTLDDDDIDIAMEIAHDCHDASIGYNWEYIEHCISLLIRD